MGVVVEMLSDEKGMVWPKEIAPFTVHLLSLGDGAVSEEAHRVYEELQSHGVTVLFDDRDVRAGEKFADADLIGIPFRLVVSERSMAEGGYELVERASGRTTMISESALLDAIKKLV
jgi:prolyl-tRNA synthetase